jgi:hypothetical protein
MSSACNAPLVDLGISLITENRSLTPEDSHSVRSVIQGLITGTNSLQSCLDSLYRFEGASVAINKLHTILRTSDFPIPPNASVALGGTKTRPWTAYEDQRLFAAVHRFGLHDWPTVARFVGNSRSKSQCSQRWTRGLDPRLDKSAWSEREDIQLLDLIARHGAGNWTVVARELGNRSDVQCRYRYTQLHKQDMFVVPVAVRRQLVQIPKERARQPKPPFVLEIPTKVVAPIRQLTTEPISFAPIAKEVPLDVPLSPQGSGVLQSSDSTSFLFGMSPVPLFKYEP